MTPFSAAFRDVPDPRKPFLLDHPLLTILAIVILSTICGAQGWDDMELWAECKKPWLATFLDMPKGVPSADTLRRVMGALLPGPFRKAFTTWAAGLVQSMANQVIAIDGKTVRGSRKPSQSVSPVHVVRAYVAANRMVLGQLAVESKSSELTAIPALLKSLAIKGGLVTIDAMGTHKNIAQDIVDKQADYVLPVKDNQPNLRQELEEALGQLPEPKGQTSRYCCTREQGHGRMEQRKVWVSTQLESLPLCQQWPAIQSAIRVQSERKVGEKDWTIEQRYFISSRKMTARQAAQVIRSHWSIENPCHWVLDVVFHEDICPIYDHYAAENLSLIRSIALNTLKAEPTKKKLSIRQKRKLCGWDHDYLALIARSLF